MGTYIYAYIDDLHFENEEELKSRLKEELLVFGENGVSEVRINDRRAYLLRLNDLSRSDKDGCIKLHYNRYERASWETTTVNFNEGKFTGMNSWALGTKIGWSQHYQAMLVAYVLCECYSNGTYIVHGDVGFSDILNVLAYLGKKYGFELVERFIKNRCNLENFNVLKGPCYHKDQFWGTQGHVYYTREFIAASSFESWISEMKNGYKDDMEKARSGEDVVYSCSTVYLGIRLLHHMLSQDLKNINCLDEKVSRDILMKYCSMMNIDQYASCLDNLPEDIKQYREYFRKHSEDLFLCFNDTDVIQKCLSFIAPDDIPTFETVKDDFVNYYLNQDDKNLSKEENHLRIHLAIIKNYPKTEAKRFEKRVVELCEKVKVIMQRDNILRTACFPKEYEYLNELYRCTGAPAEFSDRLNYEIRRVFSEKNYSGFASNWKYEERTTEEIIDKLFDITEILEESNHVLMREDFFYKMLAATHDQELSFRLDLLCFMLNHYDGSAEIFIADWVIENDFLYKTFAGREEEYHNGD